MKTYLIVLILSVAQWAIANVEVGQMAPSFTLKGQDGNSYSLASQKGKWVVLEWFNNECPYVEKHYHKDYQNMQKLQAKWIKSGEKQGGLTWYTIGSSAKGKQGYMTRERAAKIKNEERKAKMSAILLDHDGQVGRLYGAKTTPHMYIINPQGKLAYMGAIDDQPSSRTSTLKKAKNYVSDALSALFANKAVAQASTKPYGCSVKY